MADELLQSEEFRSKHASHGMLAIEFQQAMVWTSKMKNYLATQADVDFMYMKMLGREAETSSYVPPVPEVDYCCFLAL